MAEGEREPRPVRLARGRTKRLTKESEIIASDPPIGCHAEPTTEDYMNWEASILGPEDTPYEDGIFYLKINIPEEYPFKPPTVRFTTQIYHPSISEDGKIDIPELKDNWVPFRKISDILKLLRGLLSDPGSIDGISFLRPDVGRLYLDDRIKYNQIAKEWTLKYAMNN